MTHDPSDPPRLNVEGLVIRYGSFCAVDHVGFTVYAGETLGLLGPNGAGKTSILSAIEGLIRPESGFIHVAGFDIAKNLREARSNLGVQLQKSSFQAELTVREIVVLYAGLYGVANDRAAIDGILARYDLTAVARNKTGKISGGQQQSLSLAVATLHQPPLVLLDEPTTGLDPQSRRKLWDRVGRMRADGCGIVLTTHSMEEAHATCDRIAIVDHGKIIALETPQALIERYKDDAGMLALSRTGTVTLEDVFIGLTSAGES